MKRRDFLRGLGLAALGQTVFSAASALAALQCTPFNNQGLQTCQVGLRNNLGLAMVRQDQHQMYWCWAACIEMIFGYYGFIMPQEVIVQQTWGSIVNLGGNILQVVDNLNRTWIDRHGQRFQSRADVFGVTLAMAAQELAADRPLIITARSIYGNHAMVLVSMQYVVDAFRRPGVIHLAEVRDPWPGNGFRTLTPQEWHGIQHLIRIHMFG